MKKDVTVSKKVRAKIYWKDNKGEPLLMKCYTSGCGALIKKGEGFIVDVEENGILTDKSVKFCNKCITKAKEEAEKIAKEALEEYEKEKSKREAELLAKGKEKPKRPGRMIRLGD